ncbi:MAG: hypothetical protein HeimC3_53920 [Candidatus Heimdallarchaeota archaeon LC_3]|nr:MAG: hypothetical protein HeimC3_53920 [Candidatus Heimdallarchaeota archaeon LC_3]
MDEKEYQAHSLFVNLDGDIFLDKNKTNRYSPLDNSEYWKIYSFILDKEINLYFDNLNQLKQTYYLKLFPGFWKSESVYVLKKIDENSSISVTIEFLKQIQYSINIPFKINWNSKNFIPNLIIKTKIAHEYQLQNIKFHPNGKVIHKKPEAENSIGIIKLKKLPNQGSMEGSIEYSFNPESSETSSNWGNIQDQNKRIVQIYTQELPFWKDSKELQNILKRISKFDSILAQSWHVFNFVKQFVKAENLEIRKGISNLLSEKEPVGDCDEFTDLIVTILRKLKIPVRRVTGISYPNTFHAWPEVFSSSLKKWLPIDAAQNVFGYLKSSIIPLKIEGTTSHQDTINISINQAHYLTEINSEVMDPIVDIVSISKF